MASAGPFDAPLRDRTPDHSLAITRGGGDKHYSDPRQDVSPATRHYPFQLNCWKVFAVCHGLRESEHTAIGHLEVFYLVQRRGTCNLIQAEAPRTIASR
jgi:hypothetical protein